MRRGRWIGLAAIPLVVLALHFAYWRYLGGQLRDGFAAWADAQRAAGWTVSADAGAVGGWPLHATLPLRNVRIVGGGDLVPKGIAWQSPAVTLGLSLLDPRELALTATGRQSLTIGGGPAMPVDADQLGATLPLGTDGAPVAVDLLARQVTAGVLPAQGARGQLSVGLLQAHLGLQRHDGAFPYAISTEAIALPTAVRWPLGEHVASASTEGTVSGTFGTSGSRAERAAAWRGSGGSVEVSRFALGWGPLGLSATATLALDEQLQPMGAGTARLVGYDAALDALAANGALSRSAVVAAKAVLSLLAPAPGDGEPSAVDVPLTLQYRTLSMRQIPLIRLPELDWTGP